MSLLRRLKRKMFGRKDKAKDKMKEPLHFHPKGGDRGTVLYSYVVESLTCPDEELPGHSNRWESREILRILLELGYSVDAIHYRNQSFMPTKPYVGMIDINSNLQRVAPFLPPQARKLMLLGTSHPYFHNRAELERVEAFEKRTGRLYSPKRVNENAEIFHRSLVLADACALIGNERTLSTYPIDLQHKIRLMPVTSSPLRCVRDLSQPLPSGREFLWLFGYGLVHKGLDLVLEVFARRPDLVLHIAGGSEPDFMLAYEEILRRPNIRIHGFLETNSKDFWEKVKDVFCFIAPSCSEGTSPAVVTCMQLGFFPIVSRQTGVTLPEGCGLYLSALEEKAIEAAIDKALQLPAAALQEQIRICQAHALDCYSQSRFRAAMEAFLIAELAGEKT